MSARCARLAVVGLGRIGRLHAANLAGRVAGARLGAVVDAAEPRARGLGERYGVPWHTALEGALCDGDLDGVVIAAPTPQHAELVERAAAAGRHVLCEKPLGLDIGASRRAVAAARAAGVELQVGFQRRFDPDWRALMKALDEGELGQLALFRSSHRNAGEPEARGALGDVFADLAVHDLDAARWLGGEVAEVLALARHDRAGTACAASIALRFESGALGLIDVDRGAGYGFECSAELVGSQATARTGYCHRRPDLHLLREGRASTPLARDHAERHEAAYVAELDHFADLVMGRAAPRATGSDALAALELAALAVRGQDPPVALAGGAP